MVTGVVGLGCGAAATESAGPPSGREQALGAGMSASRPVELCHMNGDARTDYSYVANYRCSDGTVPLRGDMYAAAAARQGNVGAGEDGHIVDLYLVPCSPRPVDLYVDAYHCGPGVDAEIDLNNLSPETLKNIAATARAIETVPFDGRAPDAREGVVNWVQNTSQLTIYVCPLVLGLFTRDGYEHAELITKQFVASLTAATIERSGQSPDAEVLNTEGVIGALRLYEVVLAERGEAARDASLELLRTRKRRGELQAYVAALVRGCADSDSSAGLGFVAKKDGQSVWPPQGPGCARLVACCEAQGAVKNGAAVSGHPAGMMCLLGGMAAPDCGFAMTALDQQGIGCPQP